MVGRRWFVLLHRAVTLHPGVKVSSGTTLQAKIPWYRESDNRSSQSGRQAGTKWLNVLSTAACHCSLLSPPLCCLPKTIPASCGALHSALHSEAPPSPAHRCFLASLPASDCEGPSEALPARRLAMIPTEAR